MNKKAVIAAICLAVFLLLNFFGKSYLRRRDAMRVIRTILTCWEENDIPKAISYWEQKNDSPPVYDLLIYEIGEATFGKKDGVYTASVPVTLYFPTSHAWPSGKVWTFRLDKTRYGWKVVDFRRSAQ